MNHFSFYQILFVTYPKRFSLCCWEKLINFCSFLYVNRPFLCNPRHTVWWPILILLVLSSELIALINLFSLLTALSVYCSVVACTFRGPPVDLQISYCCGDHNYFKIKGWIQNTSLAVLERFFPASVSWSIFLQSSVDRGNPHSIVGWKLIVSIGSLRLCFLFHFY